MDKLIFIFIIKNFANNENIFTPIEVKMILHILLQYIITLIEVKMAKFILIKLGKFLEYCYPIGLAI